MLTFGEMSRESFDAEAFMSPLKFRGPDHKQHEFLEKNDVLLWFGHRRLSIIDLSESGNQPMTSPTGRSFIVFNGEIYNYKDLRKSLEVDGCKFDTQSDTEVILNAYERWGIRKALSKIDGMFAFALFDKESDSLVLARDRFGKKPLYYTTSGKSIWFSSDIRSFKAIRDIRLSLDTHAVGYFFSELGTPGRHSIWREVKKLEPSSYVEFNRSGMSQSVQYWSLNYSADCVLRKGEIKERTDELLVAAIRKRMVADVNIGAMLSGGIDSSLVVSKMAALSSRPVKTYSVGFSEQGYNELGYARHVSSRFETDHTELTVNASDFSVVDKLILEYGEPFADSSMIPTYLVSKAISQNEKVVLGGDGGDELFAGYDSYWFAYWYGRVKQFGWLSSVVDGLSRITSSYRIQFLQRLLSQTRKSPANLLARHLSFSEDELRILARGNADLFEATSKEHSQIWKSQSVSSDNDLIRVLAASTRTRLLNDYLVKLDRASMFASLEMRSPFLDKDLAEFASTLKPAQLLYNGPKSILKDLAQNHFSSKFVNRQKMGFALPLKDWLRGGWRAPVYEVILGGKQGLIDLDYSFAETLLEQHCKGECDHTHKIWSLYVFHLWANQQ